jgi:transposase
MQLQLKTVLNHVHPIKGFVYKDVRLLDDGAFVHIDTTIAHRANSKARCSKCMRELPSYDHLPMRRFEFVPLWAIPVFLLCSPRRVECPQHWFVVEQMPWSDGKIPGGRARGEASVHERERARTVTRAATGGGQ